MFPMVEMSRLTVAAPLDSMDDVLAACDALGCVHVQPYEQFEEGIGVGQAAAQEGRGELLTNVRAVRAATSAVNTGGAMPRKQVEGLIDGSFLAESRRSWSTFAPLTKPKRPFNRWPKSAT